MIAVIDTNCLLASIPPQSTHYWLYLAFKEEKFDWLISNEILTEYEEKLIEKYSKSTANIVLNILSIAPNVIFKEPYFKWNLVEKDPDDNKFADLAMRETPIILLQMTNISTIWENWNFQNWLS
jgi:predicted nucleic acid-binding protein